MRTKILLSALLAVACLVVGALGGCYAERRRSSREGKAAAEAHRVQLAALHGEADQWAEVLATRHGEAVLRSFVAGIAPSILTDRRESLEISAVSLLREPGVEGIHVVRPDGSVVYSSDAKLATTGERGDKAAWAVAVTDFATRPSSRPGVVDLAVPVSDSEKVLAVVWLEFGHVKVRDTAKPAGLAGAASPPPPT